MVVLAGLAAAAAFAGEADQVRPPVPPPASDTSSMPPEGSQSSAWYCPGGIASDAVGVKEVVTATNLSDVETVAAVTLMSPESPPTNEEMTIPAHGIVSLVPSELSDVAHPSVIVEPFSSDVVVEQTVIAAGELEMGPCATQPSSTWYFADGTTVRGVEQWLVLFNPFGYDAIVDVSFLTEDGRKAPGAMHGLEVPRRSSISVKVHETVRRQELVSTFVDARVGRIVAQQSAVYLPDSGRSGVTTSFGAVAPSVEWWFADGSRHRGQERSIGIANPAGYDTEVDVQVVADGDAMIDPVTVSVPRDSVVRVTMGGCDGGDPTRCVRIPVGLDYSVLVSSATDVPFVAQSTESWTDERSFTGMTSLPGAREPADRWVFARATIQDADSASLAVLNAGSAPVTVDLALVTSGGLVEPGEAHALEVAPGERRVVDLLDLLASAAPDAADAGLVVTSSAPVVVERFTTRSRAVTRSIGVPDRG